MLDTSLSVQERFEYLREHLPEVGDILTSKYPNEKIGVFVEIHPGEGKTSRIMYVHALIDRERTGWYLTNNSGGVKVLVAPRSQQTLCSEASGNLENLQVQAVRVLRRSQSGKALVVEVV